MHIIDKDDDGDEDEQYFWGEQIEDRAFVAETRSDEFMTFFFQATVQGSVLKSEENFKRKIFQYSTPLKLNVNSSNFPK